MTERTPDGLIARVLARPWLAPASFVIVTLAMAAQLFLKINRFAVNILFSDQWDTYQPLFDGAAAWTIFHSQVGQLRLGMGGLLSAAVAGATNWNTRAESFAIGMTMVLICVAAVFLKRRLFGPLTLWDTLIPMISLSVTQTEVPIFVPFPSHSTVPVLLLLLFCICLTYEDARVQFGIASVLAFLAAFTGWGLFLGFLAPFVFGYVALYAPTAPRQTRMWAYCSLVLSIASLALYFGDYVVYSGVECFTLPHYPLTDYWWFIGMMFSNSVGFGCGRFETVARVIGSLLIPMFLALLAVSIARLVRRSFDTRELVIAILLAFAGMFVVSSAAGRVCLGDCTAASPRYQPLLVPAWLAVYFAVMMIKRDKLRLVALSIVLVCCFLIPQARYKYYQGGAEYSRNMKLKWRDCYLEKEDPQLCDQLTGTSIFAPIPSIEARGRLDLLKERRLNFYANR